MNGKLWRVAVALLPICVISAQSSEIRQQADHGQLRQPSPEAMRNMAADWQRMRAQATAVNDLAGNIHSLGDARRLVDLVAVEFSKELPPEWATRSLRERIARAEYESAAEGALIPEQRVADAWNDYLEKIGAPRQEFVNAEEIHTLRDTYYVTAQLFWARDQTRDIWTVPNIYALGPDGKVANGCRALEALNILWQLGNQPELLQNTRKLIGKGQRWSDMVKNPSRPPKPGTGKGYLVVAKARPNLIQEAAYRYVDEHGARALNRAVEGLLNELFAS